MVLDTMDSKNSKKLSKKSVIMSPTWEEAIEEMKVVSEIKVEKTMDSKNLKKLSKKSIIMSPTWEETIGEMKVVSEMLDFFSRFSKS